MANSKESESEDNRIFSKHLLAQAKECFAKKVQDRLEIQYPTIAVDEIPEPGEGQCFINARNVQNEECTRASVVKFRISNDY
jgi:hypothetical protein